MSIQKIFADRDYVDQKISSIPTPDVSGQISTHNTSDSAHNDIRDLISGLTTRVNTILDSDDVTLDQMSEIVAYIKSNKSLIESITTNKVNVSDIINNLTTNVTNKPLSAAQGVALKALIDAITVPTKLSDLTDDATHRLVTDTEKTAWNNKSNFSGNYNDLTNKPSIPTKVSQLTNDSGYITGYTETDPTVPSWAKASTKPSYTKSEVGLGNVDNVKQYSASNPPPYPVTKVNNKTGAVTLSASDVGADASGTAASLVNTHNTAIDSHVDIRERINQLSDEISNKLQLTPEFANSIDECIDTAKLYVLPDGYIYAYMSNTGALFTNQLVNAIDTDGKPYNGGLGYKMNYYIGSSGNEGAYDGALLTGYIPISDITKLTLRVSGYKSALNTQCQMKFYNASFANIKLDNTDLPSVQVSQYGASFALEPALNNEVYTFTFDFNTFKSKTGWYSSQLVSGGCAYVRISIRVPNLEKTFITINEPIAFGSTSSWQSTGHQFIPADCEERIIPLEKSTESHETRIKALEMYGSDSTSSEDVPVYIKTEADNVVNRLIEKQGSRCFTMIGISDFHYSGAGDNKDNLIRACKAISYIANRIHVDAIATLGDNLPYGYEYNDNIRANADRWSKEINEILAITQKSGIIDFRTPGNHDRFGTTELYMPDNAIYSFISGYNRQCDYVNSPIGYAYRDFVGYNLRVIVLNTAETEGKGRFEIHSGYHMSSKQYNWLIDTLDISDKPNASDWQILVLSHHKADDYQVAATNATTNNYILPNILHAYNIGGSYTGVNAEDGATISCNFAEKNSAKLIGQIHGHHHAYIYGNLLLGNGGTQTNVMAVSTPTSAFGTGSGHNDDNDDNWHDSIKDTAQETAFCVYSIDLDNHVIHAIHYGNGIDREINY